MKLSNNTIILHDYPQKDDHLLFSTRTQGMVKINKELKQVIENYYQPQNFHLKAKYCDELEQLHKIGMLVEDEDEDRKKLEKFFHQLKYSVKKSCLPVTILTTDACNFNCTYCFEKDSRENVNMNFSTAILVMDWINKQIKQFEYEELYVTFYGGEPLVNKPILDYMTAHLKKKCESIGVRFKFMLQTNGYLMRPEYVDKYLEQGMVMARVSLDGLAYVHDRNRPLKGGGGTFHKVIENILASVDKVEIGLSVSYDKDDVKHIEELFDYLYNLGILYKLGEFIFSPIHPSFGPREHPEMFRQMSCMTNYDDEIIISATKKIQKMMDERKLPMKTGMAISACSLTRANAGVTIDQRGRMYKCNSMLGYPEFSIGDVRDKSFNAKHQEFIDLDVWQKCPQDCAYLPMCSGGCRFMAFLESGTFSLPTCKKNYLDKMVPEFIKKEYEALVGSSGAFHKSLDTPVLPAQAGIH